VRPLRPTLALAAIALLAVVLLQSALAFRGARGDYGWFDPVVEVRGLVLERFVSPVDDARMRDSAIAAMVESLDDPYTVYVPPSDAAEFNKDMRGTYVGIGAEIDIVDGWLNIVSPLDDSPALAAGVQAGDVVLSIEGETTFGLTASQCADRLMGVAGSSVNIRVRHLDGIEQDLAIVRQAIRARTIKGFRREGESWDLLLDPDDRIAYIRITQFTDDTVADLRAAIASIEPPPAGLILDLRFNGGGTLQAAIETADLFLEKGTIVSIASRQGIERSWSGADAAEDLDIPVVVLVNGASASASEIVSGGLQENGRAKVLGQRTFGKGSVQEVRELPDDGGILKITTAHYALPSGRSLHRTPTSETWGVDPDPGFHVAMSDEENRAMITSRRQFEVIGHEVDESAERWDDAAWLRGTLGDPQLAAALESMQHRLRTGEWLKVGDDSAPATVAADDLRNQREFRRRLLRELEAVDARIGTLEGIAAEAPLLPESDLTDGEVRVLDADGKVIATFKITDADSLAPILRQAPLAPIPAVDAP